MLKTIIGMAGDFENLSEHGWENQLTSQNHQYLTVFHSIGLWSKFHNLEKKRRKKKNPNKAYENKIQ